MGYSDTLVKLIGDGCIVFGIIITAFGLLGLAGGYGITFYIGGELASPQEAGQRILIIGIILFLVGIVVTYIRRKKME